MNEILTLTGKRFEQQKRSGVMGSATLPKGEIVRLDHLKKLYADLVELQKFWENEKLVDGALVDVCYKKIVAKSNRIEGILRTDSKTHPNESVVGARFNDDKNKHIITHFVSMDVLNKAVKDMKLTIDLFSKSFKNNLLSDEQFNRKETFLGLDFSKTNKTNFKRFIRDACFVECFKIPRNTKYVKNTAIVTLYDTNSDVQKLLSKIGIDISNDRIMDKTTVLLDEHYTQILFAKASYLVSMAVEDLNHLSADNFFDYQDFGKQSLPNPINEPTIGVLDTLFDQRVYFSNWVDFHDEISDQITKNSEDYRHGTAVTSLIVDGPNLNSNLEDGCGRFKVRHFGVSLASGFNSFSIIKSIKRIIETNQDIKVWNLSLGSNDEIRENFISAEGASLDELQYEFDIIFVIAGTNQDSNNAFRKRIGAPADSLNSLIVNSVDSNNKPASYSRKGMVLSFFTKPDISYYGGGNGEFINVVEPLGLAKVAGTSYAAPLVSRKLGYLIHIMGLSREVAKALVIDSAIGWSHNQSFEDMILMGNGVIPINIKDVLQSSDDEIKFMVSDVSEKYDSYNYNFPVPVKDESFPYIAKVTMVYFPKTSRSQGVDYTNTELNIKFGRLNEPTKQGGNIISINNDQQNIDDGMPHYLYEADARKLFRKWDNVKHLGENFSERKKTKPIINKQNPQWGMSVKTTERLTSRDGENIRFGVVVTLKAIDGINRLEEFINSAQLRGWLVNSLQVDNQIEVYNQATEEIEFE